MRNVQCRMVMSFEMVKLSRMSQIRWPAKDDLAVEYERFAVQQHTSMYVWLAERLIVLHG
jgi:hypothetical protein